MRKSLKLICLLLCLVLAALPLAACGDDTDGSGASVVEPPPFVGDEPEYLDETSVSSSSEPVSVSVSESESESESEVSSSSSEPETQAAPTFIDDTPAVSVSGNTATATFKTDVDSTVNVILATTGDAVSTATFYNYFNRGSALSQAVSKKTAYNVGSAGKSLSFDIPDYSKGYYLLINAAENASGTWQSSVTVVTVYDPSQSAPGFSRVITRENDVDGNLVFGIRTTVTTNVYLIIASGSSTTPTAAEVKAGGTGYGSGNKIYAQTSATSGGDSSPYSATVQVSRSGLENGNYVAYVALQSKDYPDGPLSTVGKIVFTLS